MEDVVNPHQFGDQGTLFDAPLGQPEGGVFRGNQHARLYRAVAVPEHVDTPEKVLEHMSRVRGHQHTAQSLGLHWQHDLPTATDIGYDSANEWKNGDRGVIVEADHPGYEHIMDLSHDHRQGPPEGANAPFSKQTQQVRDYHTLHQTVGPHNMHDFMLPEVPVRHGAPMDVHAVHFHDGPNNWVRNPVQFKGVA